MTDWLNRVFNKSCQDMSEIPDESVDVCVTSPPYFNLRDYEVDGQIGLETTPGEYIERMVGVMREVRRVLKPKGTAWVNLGDSYFGPSPIRKGSRDLNHVDSGKRRSFSTFDGLKRKDLMFIPHRVAIALQQDGWWARDDIAWVKPNPMPSPVNDRCTPCKEYIFQLAKSPKYFADMTAVREPVSEAYAKALARGTASADFDRESCVRATQRSEQKKIRKQDELGKQTYTGFNERWKRRKMKGAPDRHGLSGVTESEVGDRGVGANLRNVWIIATEPFSGAHFATMPREVARRCILIGSPPGGIVLDPFMGSGTVAEVALGCGRRFVGYELNPQYHKLISDRLGLFGERSA